MKPLIGITAGTIYNKERPYSPYTYGQMHTYVEAVSGAGGIPVIIPIFKHTDEIDELFARLDGVLFAGGNDLSPKLYHQDNRAALEIDEPRDIHEAHLMKRTLESHVPLLAICRGMQLLNIQRGGTLYQDLASELPTANNHDGYIDVKSTQHLAHTLTISPDSHLVDILDATTIKSNTHHHQAVKELGEGLIVNARAEDGVIEGIEDMSNGYAMGIQAHPESIFSEAEPQWHKLFVSFVEASQKTKLVR